MSSSTLDSSQAQHGSSPMEALWAHVLRKDKPTLLPKSLDIPPVPTAPVDRNATSTRILLHDTQARLEQFSSRADVMLKGVQDANHQLKTVEMLFEKDRNSLTNDMVDLVNRSQREVQKAVGQPAQEHQLLAFQEKLELRVEGLNQRLDALQMFHQTHCQALETHSQILKSLQDQQNALLSAILSLLALVQDIPSHIGQLHTLMREVNSTVSSKIATLKQDLVNPLALSQARLESRKRQLSGEPIDPSPVALKKTRKDASVSPPTLIGSGDGAAQPAAVRQPMPQSSIIPGVNAPKFASRKIPRHRSILSKSQTKAMPSPCHASTIPSRTNSFKSFKSPLSLGPQPSPSRALLAQGTIPSLIPQVTSRSDNGERPGNAILRNKPQTPLPPKLPVLTAKGHSLTPTLAPAQRVARIQNHNLPYSPSELTTNTPSRRVPTTEARPSPFVTTQLYGQAVTPQKQERTTPGWLNNAVRRSLSATRSENLGLATMRSFVPGNRLRDRRSPPRDGRRFIPLDDDDDDDDDDR